MSRRYRWPIVASVMLTPVLYVLSEAPLLRMTGDDISFGGFWRIYEPTDFLYENESPLSDPLYQWADLWGSRKPLATGHIARAVYDVITKE
jgi:hypothetical protein